MARKKTHTCYILETVQLRPKREKTSAAVIIIIIIISAHKSNLSSPWSQTQASLSVPSLHPKKQIKEEKEKKNNRRESLPRSDRRGEEKIREMDKVGIPTPFSDRRGGW